MTLPTLDRDISGYANSGSNWEPCRIRGRGNSSCGDCVDQSWYAAAGRDCGSTGKAGETSVVRAVAAARVLEAETGAFRGHLVRGLHCRAERVCYLRAHRSEETIGYLIVGNTRALLFDTGMGIGDLKALTLKLSKLPIIVLNSHTHDDHVGNTGSSILSTAWTPSSRDTARRVRRMMRGGDRAGRDLWFAAHRIRSRGIRDAAVEGRQVAK